MCEQCENLKINQYSEDTVNRLNYGLMYHYKGEERPTTGIWTHTLRVQLPNYEFGREFLISNEGIPNAEGVKRKNGPSCLAEIESNGFIAKELCTRFRRQMMFLVQVAREGHRKLFDLVDDIRNLIPERGPRGEKEKRALLPFVGSLLSSLFGVSTEADVEAMNKNMIRMAETMNKELNVLKKTTTDLSSYITISSNRLDNLVQTVKNNAIENVKLIETGLHDVTVSLNYYGNLSLHIMQLQHAIDTLEKYYSNFLSSLEILVSGYLPMYLVPEDSLRQVIHSIEESLQELGNFYHLVHASDNLNWYYRRANFLYTRDDIYLYISLQIPLTSFSTSFKLFHLTSHYLVLHDDSLHVTELQGVPWGFAVSQSNDFYYYLNENEMRDIETKQHSNIRRIFYKSSVKSCIHAIYFEDKTGINETCNYKISMHTMTPQIEHISERTYLLTNISEYTLQCPNETITRKGCASCLLFLKPHCSLHTSFMFIPANGGPEKFKEDTSSLQHITNLPLLMQFFSNETLQDLKGDSQVFTPPLITLPKFKFYEHNLSKTFAYDEKLKIDLSKASAAVKTDGVIVNSLSEAVVLGRIPVPNDFWLSAPGIVIESLGGVIVLLIAHNCYLLHRMRYLSIAVTVLQNSAVKTNADKDLIFNYFETKQNSSFESANVHFSFSDYQMTWNVSVVSLIFLILLVFLCYKLKKRYCFSVKVKTYVILEFVSKTKPHMLIPCLTLQGNVSDFEISAKENIRDVFIDGKLKPKLNFRWETLLIKNKVSGQNIQLKSNILLTWNTARKLREIIQHEFIVHIALMQNNIMTRVD